MATRKKEAAKKSSAPQEARPLVVRSFDLVKGPPGLLGWSHLLVPDEAFGKSMFKADIHYTDAAKAALLDRINAAYWDLIPDLKSQAEDAKASAKLKVQSKADILAYLSEKFKEPKEGDLIQFSYFQFAVNSTYMSKGEEKAVTVKLFDQHGAPLDMKAAKMGRESVVIPLFTVGVWAGSSPFSKWAALPTLRLSGLQLLKLKSYAGGGQSSAGEVTEADLKFLDDSFAPEDLSMFAAPAPLPKSGKNKATETGSDEMDDEIPF